MSRLSLIFSLAMTLFFLALLPLQTLRIAIRNRERAGGWRTSIAHAILTMISKWANVIGQRQYARDRAAGRHARLFEYKSTATIAAPEAINGQRPLTTDS